MNQTNRRYTVYLEESLHRALKVKAAETEYSVSELVNEAVLQSLREDVEDLAAFDQRKNEKIVSFEEVVKKLKADGKL